MRIASVGIKNFRCLQNVEIDFGQVTTFIGPNGAGKSTVLRALDWFFNGDNDSLTDNDIFAGAPSDDCQVSVRVTFGDLSSSDRAVLGEKYAPVAARDFTATRTWEPGNDKFTGKALAFPPFEAVRTASGAKDKRAALTEARGLYPNLDLPTWTTIDGTAVAMDEWERTHPEQLREATVSATHFFGFRGQGKLSGVFDYVLAAADLRASEESIDGRGTIIGRILERSIDRSAADEAFAHLVSDLSSRQAQINEDHLATQLDTLAQHMSDELTSFALGRLVRLKAESSELKVQPARVAVFIQDDLIETSVDRQGHGFQRTLLITALKLLAARGTPDGTTNVICLAIEEPELYQHPTQARAFANVLRDLARTDQGFQITYATHSPYFIEPREFSEIRRVVRARTSDSKHSDVQIHCTSQTALEHRLIPYVDAPLIQSRWAQICMKNLSEALFAEVVVLVEGECDRAILEGIGARTRHLAADGIEVAHANGKDGLFILHAILDELGIRSMVVFDNDSGIPARMRKDGRHENAVDSDRQKHIQINRNFCKYFGILETDYPIGPVKDNLVAVPDMMEAMLETDWPEWRTVRDALIDRGQGVGGKNADTYGFAALQCKSDPQGTLAAIVAAARLLARRPLNHLNSVQ